MNQKQLGILLVLVLVLGGAGLFLLKSEKSSWSGGEGPTVGKKLLGNLAINDVARISIKSSAGEVTLAKKDDLWRVKERNDYPANFSEITDVLRKLSDLKVVQSEKVGPSQLPRLQLAPGPGTNGPVTVEFKDVSDKPLRTLLLGKMHTRKSNRPSAPMGMDMEDGGFPDGRYVKLASDADSVALISDPLTSLEPKPEHWLDKEFIKVEKARSVGVDFPTATNSWKITRETETGEWKLADAKPEEKLDTAKIAPVSNPLASTDFSDVAAGAKPESLGLDKPTVVKIETFDNFAYTVNVGAKTNENYPLSFTVAAQIAKERTPGKDEKPEDKAKLDKEFADKQKRLEEKLTLEKGLEKWIYLVPNWTMDSLLKDRAQFLVEKKEEPKKDDKPAAGDPGAIEVPKPPGEPK
jgi:hypothetical protein